MKEIVKKLVPQWLKTSIQNRRLPWALSRQISPYLPQSICVDVGASYYPHTKWLTFLNSPNTEWLAVEPNTANIAYTKTWGWPCKINVCQTGLSKNGGKLTLYVTNVDSGSSLLPPEIPTSMKHRIRRNDYFFPVRECEIDTITLEAAIGGLPEKAPIFVKLDTQGTELSILQGADQLLSQNRIVGIESEASMLAIPVMKGSGKFWELCEYLESKGFELLIVHPISAVPSSEKLKPSRKTYVNECDAIFALRRDVASKLGVEFRASLLGFYITNTLYEEALALLSSDVELSNYLSKQGCPLKQLITLLKEST